MIVLFLTLLSYTQSYAAEFCERPAEDIVTLAKQVFEKKSWESKEIKFWQLSLDLVIEGNSNLEFKRNINWEGFVTSNSKFFRLIPGLGLGVKVSHSTVAYVCFNLNQLNEKNNLLRIIFLEQSFFLKKINIVPVSLQLRPVSEGELLASHVLGSVGVDSSKMKNLIVPSDVLNLLHGIVGKIVGAGASEIVIKPEFIEIYPSFKVLGARLVQFGKKNIEIQSTWLKNDGTDQDSRK